MFNLDPMVMLLTLPGIILGFAFHEFSHAIVADRLGDPTPRNQGKLTLDPRVHIDLFGLILIILLGFGWAKPVQTSPRYFKHPKRDSNLVALAGPVINLAIALSFGILLKIIIIGGLQLNTSSTLFDTLIKLCFYTIRINIVLFIFNLLPVPGLDGFHVLKNLIPLRNYNIIYALEKYGTIILIIIIVTPVASYVIGGPIAFVQNTIFQLLDLSRYFL